MRPRYMTRMRSESEKISSISAEITNTARPASRISTRMRWIASIAPMSTPLRRLFGDDHDARRRVSSRASWTFCWLPPESEPARRALARAAHVELPDQFAGPAPRRLRRQHRPARELREMPDRHVLPHRARQRQADARAGRPECRRGPRRAGAVGRHARKTAPQIATRPETGRRMPAMHSNELVLAVALDAGEADDLARPDGEATRRRTAVSPRSPSAVRPSTLRRRVLRRTRLRLVHAEKHRAPDHEARQMLRR